jgi:nicotinamidase-related amidase
LLLFPKRSAFCAAREDWLQRAVAAATHRRNLKDAAMATLDAKTALILIDLQNGIVAMPGAHPMQGVIRQAAALAAAFRAHDLPVVLVNVAGRAPGRTEQAFNLAAMPKGWTDLIPELHRQPEDHCITKYSWGAFTNTGLEAHLRALGVTQIVLAGVATSAGVESTARAGYERGFNVTLAVDAMTDRSAEAHDNSVKRIFPRLGETAITQDIIALLHAAAA